LTLLEDFDKAGLLDGDNPLNKDRIMKITGSNKGLIYGMAQELGALSLELAKAVGEGEVDPSIMDRIKGLAPRIENISSNPQS